MIPSMIDGMPVGNFIEWHPLMLINEESGFLLRNGKTLTSMQLAEYRVPL